MENTDKLTAAEAVFGFAGWLTSRPEKTVMSSADDAACIARLCGQFTKENGLAEPRDRWENNLIHPSGECSHGAGSTAKAIRKVRTSPDARSIHLGLKSAAGLGATFDADMDTIINKLSPP
jgi:hypothetical protein